MKAVIYYRKSTDRDDKQANSLEHQLDNCRSITKRNSLEVYKEIGESRSAKTEGTRSGFNELIKICKASKIDYIIIDEPKRLSRNNLDTSRIIDLLDKNQIVGILGTSREYRADNSRDKFLLQLDLSLSKMDNEDRAKDIKNKMTSCINNTGRFLGKAPFGYKNVTIKKGHKEIHINKLEAKVVKEIYLLRLENKAFNTIANIIKKKYGNKIDIKYEANRFHKLVTKRFYYGIFSWDGKDIAGTHIPLITKEIYDKANNIGKGVHQKIGVIKSREYRPYPLKGFIKDSSGIFLTTYVKKGITYYNNQYRSDINICINQNKLFEKVGKIIEGFEEGTKNITDIDKTIILDLVKKEKIDNGSELYEFENKINFLKKKQEKLLDLKLDEVINNKDYLSKYNQIESEIKDLNEQINGVKKDDFVEKTQIMLELAGSLYQSYFRTNDEGKAYITRNLMLELFIDTKKELRIAESPLLKSSKILNFFFGNPTENGTPVSALRRPYPNH